MTPDGKQRETHQDARTHKYPNHYSKVRNPEKSRHRGNYRLKFQVFPGPARFDKVQDVQKTKFKMNHNGELEMFNESETMNYITDCFFEALEAGFKFTKNK